MGCVPTPVEETQPNTLNEDPTTLNESNNEDSISTGDATPSNQTINQPELNFLQKFSELMKDKPDAASITHFMDSELSNSAKDEADIALSRLISAQESIKNDWSDMLMDGRVQGFQDMGYIWDPAQIDSIQDTSIRAMYQTLIDSKCRVMTYEEMPVIETDWKSMQSYNTHLSDAASLMIQINRKVQNYEYGAYPHNFEEMINDLIQLERALKYRPSDYLSHHMNNAYNYLIGEMFYSIEGINMDYWDNPTSPLILALKEVTLLSPNSDIARLAKDFIALETGLRGKDDYYDKLSTLISGHNPFGLQSAMRFNQVSNTEGNISTTLDYLYCPQKSGVEQKINNGIDKGLSQLIQEISWSDDNEMTLNVNSYSTFTSTKFYAVTLFASYTDTNGGFEYNDHHMMFDLKTGQQIAFSELLKQHNNSYEQTLLNLLKDKFIDEQPLFKDLLFIPDNLEFQIDEYGMGLYFKPKEISNELDKPYTVYMSHNELAELYDVIELYE